jgi:hypothetical protein
MPLIGGASDRLTLDERESVCVAPAISALPAINARRLTARRRDCTGTLTMRSIGEFKLCMRQVLLIKTRICIYFLSGVTR